MFTDYVLERFLKLSHIKNSNSWFLAFLNEFSEGLFLFEILLESDALQKSIFHVSNLRVNPIYSNQFDTIGVQSCHKLLEAGLMFQFRDCQQITSISLKVRL